MEPRQQEQLPRPNESQPNLTQYETGVVQTSPESTQNSGETNREVGDVRAEAVQAAMPTAPVLPAPILPTASSDDSAATGDDGAAMLANDDDLIETEWVNRAKKILDETKDDPYKREYEISKLQIEYIRQRYGRIIGQAED